MHFMFKKLRGSLEELSGRTWVMLAAILLVLVFVGPPVIQFIRTSTSNSVSTTSSQLNFYSYTQ
ncbi:hypothetical protein AAC03nite_35480 [Alicyclobacillus acidoterrestris]|nr:hypothetical protein AAC03nite_35480 [Alicyclobacillus acidoterrestris]